MADPGPSDKPLSQAGPSNVAPETAKKIPAPPREIPPFLRPLTFMGVPKTVLTWKPRLPSRNWTIFFTVTGTLTSLYLYDRKECKAIRQEYKDRVKYLAEQPMHPKEYPRKVQIYACKSPGDEDHMKSLLYFKKYIKPVLVAAAIDFETLNGTRHGGLAKELRERIYSRRRQLLNLEPWGTPTSNSASSEPDMILQGILPFSLQPQQQLERELDGATVIVGRPALKEWAWALKTGWTTKLPPARQDLDDVLARELSEDSTFDEVEETSGNESLMKFEDGEEADGAGAPLPSRMNTLSPQSYNPAFQMKQNNGSSQAKGARIQEEAGPNVDAALLEPPVQIPAQPPVYFVDYTNLIGFKNVPRKIYGFFNEREKVRNGGQAALAIALGNKNNAREMEVETTEDGQTLRSSPPQGGDLDWGLESERFYPNRFHKTLDSVEKSRTSFYTNLPKRLQETRSYVRGQRELTLTEKNDPPKTEGQLREERFDKEREWRTSTMAYKILQAESGVEWDPRFRGSLRVLEDRNLQEAGDQSALA